MNTVESLLDGVKEHAPGAWESTGLAGYIRGTLTTRLLLQILVCSGRTRGDPGRVRSYNLHCEVYAVLASDVNGAFTWRRCPGVMRPLPYYISHIAACNVTLVHMECIEMLGYGMRLPVVIHTYQASLRCADLRRSDRLFR